MAEESRAVRPASAVELRAECDATRARITRHVAEVESRLRAQVQSVIGSGQAPADSDTTGHLNVARLMSGLKSPGTMAMVVGAVVGYIAMRRWAPGRPNA